MANYLFTSESVTEGHPDKVCDQISDAVLDEIMARDPEGRVACETAVCAGMVHIMGEISASCYLDIAGIARNVVREIGYDRSDYGFDGSACAVVVSVNGQSPDIALGVDRSLESREGGEPGEGAGDQGIMFGYACDETPELMPLPLSLAHRLCRQMANVRKQGVIQYMRPDGKSQVTVEYNENRRPVRVDTVVLSAQHAPDVSLERIRRDMVELVAKASIPGELLDKKTNAYAARWVAKNIVAAKLARRCQIQLAYAIGVARPVSILADTFGTGVVEDAKLRAAVERVFDLRPAAIIRDLDLRRPIYRQLAAYGHMGREDLRVAWERADRTDALRNALA